MKRETHSEEFISEIVALAWADDVSFEEIKHRCGLAEPEVIRLMRNNLKNSSFKLWRKRVSGRLSKHRKLSQIRNGISFCKDKADQASSRFMEDAD